MFRSETEFAPFAFIDRRNGRNDIIRTTELRECNLDTCPTHFFRSDENELVSVGNYHGVLMTQFLTLAVSLRPGTIGFVTESNHMITQIGEIRLQ